MQSGALIVNVKDDIFKRYKKLAMIGSGSYGQVYKVKPQQSDELRALKILDKNKNDMLRNLPEIENMKKLDHPNIINIYECAEDDDNLYIVSELLEGDELFNEIHKRLNAKQPFMENEVKKIMKQILSAVAYAHSKNIVHRDIKPENILIEKEKESYRVVLIDWGLSKDVSNLPFMKQRIGTVDYAAPEVLKNEEYDAKCDIWSCGVILYILLSGQSPFPGRTTGEIESLIVKGNYSFKNKCWSGISEQGRRLVKEMLSMEPSARISAQQALEHEWMKSEQNVQLDGEVDNQRLQNLTKFCCQSKLVQATIQLMIGQFLEKQKAQELRELFAKIDANGDGKLSLEELINALKDQDEEEIKEIFKRVDTDNSVSRLHRLHRVPHCQRGSQAARQQAEDQADLRALRPERRRLHPGRRNRRTLGTQGLGQPADLRAHQGNGRQQRRPDLLRRILQRPLQVHLQHRRKHILQLAR